MPMSSRVTVLVAAAGAAWEPRALQSLAEPGAGITVLKRCVDLNDLLATAITGQAHVALLSYSIPGLDAECVDLLSRSGVGVVMVVDPTELRTGEAGRAGRLGISHVIETAAMDTLNDVILAAGDTTASSPAFPVEVMGPPEPQVARQPGRVVAVWGPTGAPGRTTVAVGLAAELASRGGDTFLLDVDGYGGAVAQHLGVLDESSGLLAAARSANAGHLDAERLGSLARQIDPFLRVLTGLPRADRWPEVRDVAFERLLALSRTLASHVVLDTGFNLELDADASFGSVGPSRNAMTLASLEHADEVILVGSADPVGLARLARALVEVTAVVPGCTLRVVVNRSRPSLGWGEREVRAMVEGFLTPASVHFIADDRVAADRATVTGKSLVELGDSSLRRGISALATAVLGESPAVRRRREPVRRRRAGRGH